MNEAYKKFWEPESELEIYRRVIGADQEDFADTASTIDILLRGLNVHGDALEIGCGYGRLMAGMAPHFDSVFGVDISLNMLAKGDNYLKMFPNCVVLHTNGTTLPFEDKRFDFVYSFIAFQHMPTLEIVQSNLREVARVLKPGGMCRIQTIEGEPVDREGTRGEGRLFESGESFLHEFEEAGLVGTVAVGLKHPLAIWVTAVRKGDL